MCGMLFLLIIAIAQRGGYMYQETEKFKRCGKLFFPLVGGAVLLPFLLSLMVQLSHGDFEIGSFLTGAVVMMLFVVVIFIVVLGNGFILSSIVRHTAKRVDALPYHFDESCVSDTNGSMLFVDVENGAIGYISVFNPSQIQIFNASRVDGMRTVATLMFGIRFVFYLDGKKINMYTIMEDHLVYPNSEEGREAIEEADKFVALLQEAKRVAEGRY